MAIFKCDGCDFKCQLDISEKEAPPAPETCVQTGERVEWKEIIPHHFLSNWDGELKKFPSLELAAAAAKNEMGDVTIYCGREIIKTVSGKNFFA